jgi:hypothetical protein
MVKTKDNDKDQPESFRNLLIPDTEREIISFDAIGNFKCSRCGWTHTLAECAEYRLVLANKELEKITKFVHMCVEAIEGESPVDTLLRSYRKLHSEHTEVTELMKE